MKITKAETLTVDLTEEEIVELVRREVSPGAIPPPNSEKGEFHKHIGGIMEGYFVVWESREDFKASL